MGRWILRFIGGFAAFIISRALFEVFHMLGWYPEKTLAGLMMAAPTFFAQLAVLWAVAALLAVPFLFTEYWAPPLVERYWPRLAERLRGVTALSEASRIIYERTRKMPIGQMVRELEKKPDDIMGWFRHSLCQKAVILGRLPPSKHLEKIRSNEDTAPLVPAANGADSGYFRGAPHHIYVDLSLTQRELKKQIARLKKLGEELYGG
jgi:hypothetical protein